jgi:transcriptional regulator with XRE-family HTH domain
LVNIAVIMKQTENLSKYLKTLRGANGLSLRDVEKKTGVSNALLSQLESGKVKQPSPITLYKIAEAYGVPYETLMQKTGYPVPQVYKNKDIPSANAVFSRFGKLTLAEEESLLEYLSFLRSRKRRRGKT